MEANEIRIIVGIILLWGLVVLALHQIGKRMTSKSAKATAALIIAFLIMFVTPSDPTRSQEIPVIVLHALIPFTILSSLIYIGLMGTRRASTSLFTSTTLLFLGLVAMYVIYLDAGTTTHPTPSPASQSITKLPDQPRQGEETHRILIGDTELVIPLPSNTKITKTVRGPYFAEAKLSFLGEHNGIATLYTISEFADIKNARLNERGFRAVKNFFYSRVESGTLEKYIVIETTPSSIGLTSSEATVHKENMASWNSEVGCYLNSRAFHISLLSLFDPNKTPSPNSYTLLKNWQEQIFAANQSSSSNLKQ